jgi:hypothetical protein
LVTKKRGGTTHKMRRAKSPQRKSSCARPAAVDRKVEAAVASKLAIAKDEIAESVVERLNRRLGFATPIMVPSHKFFEPLGGP